MENKFTVKTFYDNQVHNHKINAVHYEYDEASHSFNFFNATGRSSKTPIASFMSGIVICILAEK